MRIIIRSKDVRLFIPVPLRFGGIAIACIPERTIREMQSALPAPAEKRSTKNSSAGRTGNAIRFCGSSRAWKS